MTGFDITSILDFQPPRWICPACRGLVRSFASKPQRERATVPSQNGWLNFCPVCDTQVAVNDWTDGNTSFHEALSERQLGIHRNDLFNHATTLAKMVRASRGGTVLKQWPTMRLFFEALSKAREFVHFSSWGMSHVMIGALKATSMRVPVYGFVSSLADHARTELTEYPDEAPQLHAKTIPTAQGIYDPPTRRSSSSTDCLPSRGRRT